MASKCRQMSYWERLNEFKLLSNERRMERYKIIYVWKSLNGHVPSLDFQWKVRDGSILNYPKVHGPEGRIRTLQRFSLRWEGVRLFNCIPQNLRMWKGLVNTFKNSLDKFLEKKP